MVEDGGTIEIPEGKFLLKKPLSIDGKHHVTIKGAGRTKMDEIAVYEVKDGKIVKEQFFF